MASLESLPIEILIKIFGFIDFEMAPRLGTSQTLLNLTEVCKRFNEIISSEKTLIRKFTIRLKPESLNVDTIGDRKYQKLMIKTCSDDQIEFFIEALKNFGNEITIMAFYLDEDFPMLKFKILEAKSVAGIFNLCPNVKKIFEFPLIEDEYDGEVPELNLDFVVFNASSTGLKILMNSQTKSASIHLLKPNVCLKSLRGFLMKQKSLYHLSFSIQFYGNRAIAIFDNCIAKNYQFPLKYLSLGREVVIVNNEKFRGFLKDHSKTLERVDLNIKVSLGILSCFEDCKNLKILEIKQEKDWLNYHVGLPMKVLISVTELNLKFHEELTFDIAEIFPNLRRLKLKNCGKFITETFGEFHHLEELHLDHMIFEKIPKSVKVLRFFDINHKIEPKFDDESKVEELLVAKSSNLSWLPEFFAINKVQLKKILLIDVKLGEIEELALREQHELFRNVRSGNYEKLAFQKQERFFAYFKKLHANFN